MIERTPIILYAICSQVLLSGTMEAKGPIFVGLHRSRLCWRNNWSLLNAKGEVAWGMLHFGLESGDSWVPAEVNTSIRPEWFYHPGEDAKVKTVLQLIDTYYNSIGRNGTLLLNFPIMPNGLSS